jgi:hypothetical protein
MIYLLVILKAIEISFMAGKSEKLSVGSKIRVKEDIAVPEFEQVSASGWIGMIVESKGKGAEMKFIIEWDDATVDRFPDCYVKYCEEKGLYSRMACFKAVEVEQA